VNKPTTENASGDVNAFIHRPRLVRQKPLLAGYFDSWIKKTLRHSFSLYFSPDVLVNIYLEGRGTLRDAPFWSPHASNWELPGTYLRNPDRSQNYHIINSDTFSLSCWAVAELRLTKEPSSLQFETHLKPVSPFSVSDSWCYLIQTHTKLKYDFQSQSFGHTSRLQC